VHPCVRPCMHESRTNIDSNVCSLHICCCNLTKLSPLIDFAARMRASNFRVKDQGHGRVKYASKSTFGFVSMTFRVLAFCHMLVEA